jgi:hypothetical protein
MTTGMTPSRFIALAAAAALALGAFPAAGAAAARDAIEDDYPRALAAAKERSVPLLVDAWAPW